MKGTECLIKPILGDVDRGGDPLDRKLTGLFLPIDGSWKDPKLVEVK
jgi:hypothetical protein